MKLSVLIDICGISAFLDSGDLDSASSLSSSGISSILSSTLSSISSSKSSSKSSFSDNTIGSSSFFNSFQHQILLNLENSFILI